MKKCCRGRELGWNRHCHCVPISRPIIQLIINRFRGFSCPKAAGMRFGGKPSSKAAVWIRCEFRKALYLQTYCYLYCAGFRLLRLEFVLVACASLWLRLFWDRLRLLQHECDALAAISNLSLHFVSHNKITSVYMCLFCVRKNVMFPLLEVTLS